MGSRRYLWLTAAVLVVLLGAIGSVLGARAVAQDDEQNAHQAFGTSSASVASTLNLTIQHEQDLSVSAGAFVPRKSRLLPS